MMRYTHCWKVLSALALGDSLTQAEAAEKLKCWRLGARIYDLRRRGWDIRARQVPNAGNPGRHAAYYMLPAERRRALRAIAMIERLAHGGGQ